MIRTDNIEHSDYWYDYTRNDPDAENPFTDAFDYMMAETVVNGSPQPIVADIDDMYSHHFIDDTMMGTVSVGVTDSYDFMYPYTMTGSLSSQMRQEIKDIINEVLDEREVNKKLEGPYDFPEEWTTTQ